MKVCGHCACEYQGLLLVFGGLDPENGVIYTNFFAFDGRRWRRSMESLTPRFCGSMVQCNMRRNGEVLMVGGCDLTSMQMTKFSLLQIDPTRFETLN